MKGTQKVTSILDGQQCSETKTTITGDKWTIRVVNNLYVKSVAGKCYICWKPEHDSNERPKQRPIHGVKTINKEDEDQ